MSGGATVTVADILELRADGLSEEEVWSLLCQAVQTLQDLFLSGEIIGDSVVPLVSPHTLGISSKGRVVITLVDETHPCDDHFLAPEYRTLAKKSLNCLDWEKMWVYSLGRSLLSSVKTASTTANGLMVLRLMTEKDPAPRASLMSLLNIISEHCRTSLPLKPFSHLVMEMYREVFGTPPQCLLSSDIPNEEFRKKTFFDDITPQAFAGFRRSEEVVLNPRKTGFRMSTPGKDSESNGTIATVKRNPVQRAPSRLYRGPSEIEAKDGESQEPSGTCVGPEFVVRGMEPLRVVHVGDAKPSQRRALTVILLSGQRIQFTCDPNTITCCKLFEILVQVEQLEDNYIFGLACMINGDFVFIPAEMKLHKVGPSGWKENGNRSTFFLYVRVKFFLPSLRGVKSSRTRHLVYLQLRRSLLEQQIKCELQELLTLGGLALQAEFGNFEEEEHGSCSYFLLEHYLPEELIDERLELEGRLQKHHKSRFGIDRSRAEEIFVAQVQRLPEYGSHHYTASWVRKSVSIPMWVTVNPQGVYLYEKKKNVIDRKIHEAFVWKNIQGLSFNENYFRLVPHDVFGQKVTCYKLRLDNKKSFFLFMLASFHHQFFLKLRIELSPLHALSQEFGVSFKNDGKNVFYLEKKNRAEEEWSRRSEAHRVRDERKIMASCRNMEEQQNKENENPAEGKADRREKRPGVKMGVRAFHLPHKESADCSSRRFSLSEVSCSSLDAYVIDSSIKSSDERFVYDFHETIPSTLVSKFNDMSWEEERILRKVHLTKDKYGSFGLEIVEGNNGGLFIENILKPKGRGEIDSVQRGDQLLSVNGVCLLNLNYSEALSVLKNAGDQIQVLFSQSCKNETRQKPLEHEYLRNIRYETANEADGSESEMASRQPSPNPFG